MKTKYLITFLVVGLLIIVSSICFLLIGCNAKHTNTKVAETFEMEKEIVKSAMTDSKLPSNDAECAQMRNATEADECYMKKATMDFKNYNPKLCEKITDPERKNDCYDTMAYYFEDISFCDKISNLSKADRCYYSTARVKFDDANICNNIKDSDIRNDCLGRIKKDVSFCKNIVDELNREVCIQETAVIAKNPDYCKEFSDEADYAQCILMVGAEMKDPRLCESIQNTIYRGRCMIVVSRLS